MADAKISALPASTTPLAGTEVLPIVQSGATKNVSVANLTAGRDVTVKSVIANSGSGTTTALITLYANSNGWNGQIRPTASGNLEGFFYNGSAFTNFEWNYGDIKVGGNFVQGTAAKGINFTANTPAAGKTSQLLNWYEEGTWTPNQGAAISVVGAYSSSGTYTRVGRLVTVTAIQSGATSISTSPSGIIFSNLPFTVGGGVARYSGTTALQFSNAAGAIAVGGTTNVYSCGTLSGGDTIVTTITYEV